MIDHDIHLIKHFEHFVSAIHFLQFSLICINIENTWGYMERNSLSLSTTYFWFLKVFKFLQCYHQIFIVFPYLGYWNELASDWHQLFKVFSKEFLFFCYFGKMNDFKHVFEASLWIKPHGSIVNIWTFESKTIGSI